MNALERALLWGAAILVGSSGVILGIMKDLMDAPDPYAVVHHPLQPLFLKIHIVTAPLLVFAIGVVFTRHIWAQWRRGLRPGRRSGLWTLATVVPMVFSGYLIQTVTHEGWLLVFVVVHVTTGLAYLGGLAAHQLAVWVWERRRGRRDAVVLLEPHRKDGALEDRAAGTRRARA